MEVNNFIKINTRQGGPQQQSIVFYFLDNRLIFWLV